MLLFERINPGGYAVEPRTQRMMLGCHVDQLLLCLPDTAANLTQVLTEPSDWRGQYPRRSGVTPAPDSGIPHARQVCPKTVRAARRSMHGRGLLTTRTPLAAC